MKLDDLKKQKRWVCYSHDKAPINAKTGLAASSTDSMTWSTYEEATRAVARYHAAGVGFVFTGDGLVGIDLDDAVGNNADDTAKYAKFLLGLCGGYAELSPSGKGIHIIGTGTIPRSLKKKMFGIGVEVYSTARYFTFTGHVIHDDYEDLGSIQDVIDVIYDHVAEAEEQKASTVATVPADEVTGDARDRQVAQWINHATTMMRNAQSGERHNTRIKAGRLLGGAMRAAQLAGKSVMSIDDAIKLLYNALPPDEGEEDKEKLAIRWGIEAGIEAPLQFRKEEQMPPPMTTQPQAPKREYHFTDIGNGQRFVDTYYGDLLWVPEWQQWMQWDEKRWVRIDIALVRKLAHDVVIQMYTSAYSNGTLNTELGKWAIKSETVARINAMLEAAQSYLLASPSLFDTHHDLLNVANGVVDLRRGILQPHRKELYFTKLIAVDYAIDAKAPTWLGILETVFANDHDLIKYIQRAVGYSLTGRTDEHCLFFCYGIGKNGKSTFINAIQSIMGDYSTTTSVEALLDAQTKGEAASPYMARLPGKRLAVAQEMPEGRRMNESLIKSITSSDRLSTRDLYKSVFEFVPSHHLWISGNHKPRIAGTDDGIWRRMRIIPFTVIIPEAKRRDSRIIEAELLAESAGILRWMVMGAQLWYASGLASCGAVDNATSEYRGDEDAIARFLSEECELGTQWSVNKTILYSAYKEWAEEENDKVAMSRSQKFVIRHLCERFECSLGGNGRSMVMGIRLTKTPQNAIQPLPRQPVYG